MPGLDDCKLLFYQKTNTVQVASHKPTSDDEVGLLKSKHGKHLGGGGLVLCIFRAVADRDAACLRRATKVLWGILPGRSHLLEPLQWILLTTQLELQKVMQHAAKKVCMGFHCGSHTLSIMCGRLHGTEKRHLLTLPLLSWLPGFVKVAGTWEASPKWRILERNVTKMAKATLSGCVPKRSQGRGLWLWIGAGCTPTRWCTWSSRAWEIELNR